MTNPIASIIELAKKGDRRVLIGGAVVVGGGVGLFVFLKNRNSSGGGSTGSGVGQDSLSNTSDSGGGGGSGDLGSLAPVDTSTPVTSTDNSAAPSLPTVPTPDNSVLPSLSSDQSPSLPSLTAAPILPDFGNLPGLNQSLPSFEANLPSVGAGVSPFDQSFVQPPSYTGTNYSGQTADIPQLAQPSPIVQTVRDQPAAIQSIAQSSVQQVARNLTQAGQIFQPASTGGASLSGFAVQAAEQAQREFTIQQAQAASFARQQAQNTYNAGLQQAQNIRTEALRQEFIQAQSSLQSQLSRFQNINLLTAQHFAPQQAIGSGLSRSVQQAQQAFAGFSLGNFVQNQPAPVYSSPQQVQAANYASSQFVNLNQSVGNLANSIQQAGANVGGGRIKRTAT